jgi:hypothetical protein
MEKKGCKEEKIRRGNTFPKNFKDLEKRKSM